MQRGSWLSCRAACLCACAAVCFCVLLCAQVCVLCAAVSVCSCVFAPEDAEQSLEGNAKRLLAWAASLCACAPVCFCVLLCAEACASVCSFTCVPVFASEEGRRGGQCTKAPGWTEEQHVAQLQSYPGCSQDHGLLSCLCLSIGFLHTGKCM